MTEPNDEIHRFSINLDNFIKDLSINHKTGFNQ